MEQDLGDLGPAAPRDAPRAGGVIDETRNKVWIVSLVFVLVAVDLLAGVAIDAWRPPPAEWGYFLAALVWSQLGLLGVWLGFASPWWFPVRLGVCAVCVVAWSLLLYAGPVGRPGMIELLMLGSLPMTVALGVLAVRAAGVRLLNIQRERIKVGGPLQPYQFSLQQVFLWTTVAAVVATALSFATQSRGLIYAAIVTLMVAILTWATVWAILGRGGPWRLALLLALSVAIGIVSALFGVPSGLAEVLFYLPLLHCALTAGPLALFRACGYRVGRLPLARNDER